MSNNDNLRKRGLFPRISLKNVLELPKAIYDLGHGFRVRRLEVFDRLDRQPGSGHSRMMVIAAGQTGYGLINGNYNAEFLELTERGERIIDDENEGRKFEAVYDALFSNEIFADFIKAFTDKSFSVDSVIIDYLSTKHSLGKPDAEACWNVIRQNITDFGLTQTLSGRVIIINRDVAMKRYGNQNEKNKSDVSIPNESKQDVEIIKDTEDEGVSYPKQIPIKASDKVAPEFHFNIQIHLPSDATPQTYEAIFKSIGRHLLGNRGDEGSK